MAADASGDFRSDRHFRSAEIIVPGVGHFSRCQSLNQSCGSRGLDAMGAGKPFLGICVGMQWLFESSTEAPETPGAALFAGECSRFPASVKSPHVGWNRMRSAKNRACCKTSAAERLSTSPIPSVRPSFSKLWRALTMAVLLCCRGAGQCFRSAIPSGEIR